MRYARIVSEYGSPYGPNGPPNLLPSSLALHSGVDFGGNFGDVVIAPADGYVVRTVDVPYGCGNGLVIFHGGFDRYTHFCHLQTVSARPHTLVRRGDLIGTIGDSGNARGCRPACPIVHMELSRVPNGSFVAVPDQNFDPIKSSVGCFDPAKTYPTDRLLLTYPVRCRD